MADTKQDAAISAMKSLKEICLKKRLVADPTILDEDRELLYISLMNIPTTFTINDWVNSYDTTYEAGEDGLSEWPWRAGFAGKSSRIFMSIGHFSHAIRDEFIRFSQRYQILRFAVVSINSHLAQWNIMKNGKARIYTLPEGGFGVDRQNLPEFDSYKWEGLESCVLIGKLVSEFGYKNADFKTMTGAVGCTVLLELPHPSFIDLAETCRTIIHVLYNRTDVIPAPTGLDQYDSMFNKSS
jgi:hypothetical protein